MNLLQSKQPKQAQTQDGKGAALTVAQQPLQVIELAADFLVSVHVLYTYGDGVAYEGPYEQIRQEFPWVNFVQEDLSKDD